MVGKQKSSTRNLRIHNWQVLRATLGHCQARRRGGGGGVPRVRTNPLWDVNIEVTENPKKIQKTANFITVVA